MKDTYLILHKNQLSQLAFRTMEKGLERFDNKLIKSDKRKDIVLIGTILSVE